VQRGKGRVLISTLRCVEYPVNLPSRVLSTLLTNLGARLVLGGSIAKDDSSLWRYSPLSVDKHCNHPVSDDPNGRRGWHMCGSENDLRSLPSGLQTFKGVEYMLSDPAKCGGNACVALSCTVSKEILPAEVKGIQANLKAERLYFLHNSAWGVPGFVYRVWYLEDRKAWIPGKPDPFVDVVVKPKENIDDWFFASDVESGARYLPGATVAWMTETPYSRTHGKKVGVYQMVWENPHPEKTIESIDVICPGNVGDGELFVFAITAANRKPAEGKDARSVQTSQVLPKGAQASDVYSHFKGRKYGLLLMKDGSVAAVHDAEGRPLFSFLGWGVQTWKENPATGRPDFRWLALQSSSKGVEIKSSNDPQGNPCFEASKELDSFLSWRQRIVCQPSSIVFEQSFEIANDPPEGVPWSLFSNFNFNKAAFSNVEAEPNKKPVVAFLSGGGALSFDFDDRFLSWHSSPGYSASAEGMRINFLRQEDRVKGGKDSIRVCVTMP